MCIPSAGGVVAQKTAPWVILHPQRLAVAFTICNYKEVVGMLFFNLGETSPENVSGSF